MYGDSVVSTEDLIAELNHRINSPLAAIRNALYLAACCTSERELQRYLQLANEEVTVIAEILYAARRQSGERAPARVAVRQAAA